MGIITDNDTKYLAFFNMIVEDLRKGKPIGVIRDQVREQLKEWGAIGCYGKVMNALCLHDDASLAEYELEYHLELAKWEPGTPYPVWSELDDITGCLYVAINWDKEEVFGIAESTIPLTDLIHKHSKTADDIRKWGIYTFKIVRGRNGKCYAI